jgi:hypothetical protein
MSQGIDNHIDWTIPSTLSQDRVGPSLTRKSGPQPAAVKPKHSVMDTLLGNNDLAAFDASPSDPYNSTGRQVRR